MEVKIWRDVADHLSHSRKNRVTVNLSHINRFTNPGDLVIVPGKVLGGGTIDHPIQIAALSFSEKAQSKVHHVKGKCLSIPQLMKDRPKGNNVKIIG
jgi:large subunit ribosomal protein L18e